MRKSVLSSVLLLPILLIPLSAARAADPPVDQGTVQFDDAISVTLASVRARILDPSGAPLVGLKPEDLRVRIGRNDVRVTAIDYYDGSVSPEDLPDDLIILPAADQKHHAPQQVSARGQLFVFFIEADPVDRNPSPAKTNHFRRLAESLKPDDLAAVISLDKHLSLQADFTRDREAIYQAILRGLRGEDAASPASWGGLGSLSLARSWNRALAEKASRTETALIYAAAALQPLPGEKVVIFLGKGPQHFLWPMASLPLGFAFQLPPPSPELFGAVGALQEACAEVFVLDEQRPALTPVEQFLRFLAGSTGAIYSQTEPTRKAAVDRLARETRGYYLITFSPDQVHMKSRTEPLTVALTGREGKILTLPLEWLNRTR